MIKSDPPPALDDLDVRILNLLQHDSAITNLQLAARVHASAATCLRRVQRLRDTGVIEREVVIVAPGAVGASLTAIVEVTLDHQGSERLAEFELLVKDEVEVLQCYRVGSGPDFVVVLQTRDMDTYHAFAHRVFGSAGNVRNVRAYFSTHRSKFETRIPLPR